MPLVKIRCDNCMTLRYPSDIRRVTDAHGTWNICKERTPGGLRCIEQKAKP